MKSMVLHFALQVLYYFTLVLMKRQVRKRKVFLISALDGGERQPDALAALPLGHRKWYTVVMRLAGLQNGSGLIGENKRKPRHSTRT
jgi:hypothetical protein